MLNKYIFDLIKNEVRKNNYRCLEDIVLEFPDNKQLLYYSLLLYEQEIQYAKNPKIMKRHIVQWEKEAETQSGYNGLLKKSNHVAGRRQGAGYLRHYPITLHLECTTYCCAKCTNCTHEALIQENKRTLSNIDLRLAQYSVRKLKLILLLTHTKSGDTYIDPVGLGEPLCYPYIFEMLNYMKRFFKRVWISSNALLLNETNAEKLVDLHLYQLTLSLSYFDKKVYEREIKMDYDRVLRNIVRFLEIKKKRNCKTKTTIHIFKNELNTREDRKSFITFFRNKIGKEDILEFRDYGDYTNNGQKASWRQNKKCIPCSLLWQQLMIDCHGNVWPCCMAIWKEYDSYLSLGHITEPIPQILHNAVKLRIKQFRGEYGFCAECVNMYRPENSLPSAVKKDKRKIPEYIQGIIYPEYGENGKII